LAFKPVQKGGGLRHPPFSLGLEDDRANLSPIAMISGFNRMPNLTHRKSNLPHYITDAQHRKRVIFRETFVMACPICRALQFFDDIVENRAHLVLASNQQRKLVRIFQVRSGGNDPVAPLKINHSKPSGTQENSDTAPTKYM
jgi:hypothetical protein